MSQEQIPKDKEPTKAAEDLVFDKESGSMITKEEYEKKVKEKLADPYGDPAKG